MIMKDRLTMEYIGEQDRSMIPCRVELTNPGSDWEVTWRRMRLPGRSPAPSSFLFKMVHQLLTTQERVGRTNKSVTGICKMARFDGNQ